MPKVSVVIPAYNSAHTLRRAIESALGQTYRDLEVIVVNDGSTDNTAEVLWGYAEQIRAIHQPNLGRSIARNVGIANAGGEFIAFLDADDWWLPTKLEKQIALLDRSPETGLVCSWNHVVDNQGTILRSACPLPPAADLERFDGFEALLFGNFITTSTAVVRRTCIRRRTPFDPAFRYPAEDWDLWLYVALQHKLGLVPEPLACYTVKGMYLPEYLQRGGWLETHLQIIQKLWAQHDLDTAQRLSPALQDRVLAVIYWRAACIEYALDNKRDAQALSELAFAHDPRFFDNGEPPPCLLHLLTFARMALRDDYIPEEMAVAFIQRVFALLPPLLRHLHRWRKSLLGELSASYAFDHSRAGKRQEAYAAMRRAVRQDWRLLWQNRGITSMAIESIVGPDLWFQIRKVLKGFFRPQPDLSE